MADEVAEAVAMHISSHNPDFQIRFGLEWVTIKCSQRLVYVESGTYKSRQEIVIKLDNATWDGIRRISTLHAEASNQEQVEDIVTKAIAWLERRA